MEVELLRNMKHENIIKFYEAFDDDKAIYIVLELCEGGEL